MPTLLIIKAGPTPPSLQARFSDYPAMIAQWIRPRLSSADFKCICAYTDPAFPDPDQFDGVIISGSKFSVRQPDSWIRRLEHFILDLQEARTPLFGICFGHQVIAKALGGTVIRNPLGWGLGVQEYALFSGPTSLRRSIFAPAVHEDQIGTLPAAALKLGGNKFCPNAIVSYPGHPIGSVQFHPEFTSDYLSALLPILRQRGVSDTTIADAGRGMQSLQPDTIIAQWAAHILSDGIDGKDLL